jgi:hypothetical protein
MKKRELDAIAHPSSCKRAHLYLSLNTPQTAALAPTSWHWRTTQM